MWSFWHFIYLFPGKFCKNHQLYLLDNLFSSKQARLSHHYTDFVPRFCLGIISSYVVSFKAISNEENFFSMLSFLEN